MVPKQTTQGADHRVLEGRVDQGAMGLPLSGGSVHNGGGGGFVWARVLEGDEVGAPEGVEGSVDARLGEVFPGEKSRREQG